MRILVTGCAGFIGMHASIDLAKKGHQVLGIDNLNNYYDPELKLNRLREINDFSNFEFSKFDLSDKDLVLKFFLEKKPDMVLHLAAQAGVRHSVKFPYQYADSNLLAFLNILEACRSIKTSHLVYASSSSVYGSSQSSPFEETDKCDMPNSLYAATKKSNELMAYSYSHLYGMPITGLRYFTVYGPWGRPDMAPFIFTRSILNNEPIKVFNYGEMSRDFTYIDDIVDGTIRILERPPMGLVPNNIFNIGNNTPVSLLDFIGILEQLWGREVEKILLPLQAGDLKETVASIHKISEYCEYFPRTDIHRGLENFVSWYKSYYV
jgi:UDP-glucuronate 4-epimerase